MDASATPSSGIAGKQRSSLVGRYYTWLVLTAIFSVLAFLVLQGVLEVINWSNGTSGSYRVVGSPFHITSPWSWSVKASFWFAGALVVEMKILAVLAVAAPVLLLLWGVLRRAAARLTRR